MAMTPIGNTRGIWWRYDGGKPCILQLVFGKQNTWLDLTAQITESTRPPIPAAKSIGSGTDILSGS